MDTTENNEPIANPGVSVGRTLFCLDVFFGLMLLFNGVAMQESAEQLEFGRTHDFWVTVLRPVAQVSHFSGLDRVRSATKETLGAWFNRSVQ